MDLLGTKILTMCILGSVSFLVGLSTIKLRNLLGWKKSATNNTHTRVISLLLCFGAGVLLATTLLHILPEMRHGVEEAEHTLDVTWLAELILCFGFFLVYLLEEVVHLTLAGTKHSEPLHGYVNRDVVDEFHNDMEMNETKGVGGSPEEEKKEKIESVTNNKGNQHSHLMNSSQSNSSIRDFLTVLALSFHAVFEGLAVGLEESNAEVWTLFTAISCHKFVIAFCISLELLQAGTKLRLFIIYLLTFSMVSPLGIGVGMIITSLSNTDSGYHELTVATFQGLAGGAILYMVMFEVIQREKSKQVSGLLQLLAILLGFGAMALIEIFAKHDHEHNEHDGHGHEEHNEQMLQRFVFKQAGDQDHDDDHDHDHDHGR